MKVATILISLIDPSGDPVSPLVLVGKTERDAVKEFKQLVKDDYFCAGSDDDEKALPSLAGVRSFSTLREWLMTANLDRDGNDGTWQINLIRTHVAGT